MASTPSLARHRALYRALLGLYPRAFREGYSEPMVQLFSDHLRQVGTKAWLLAIPDLVRTVPTQRIEAIMARVSPGVRVLALAFIVLGAAVVSMGLGGGGVPVVAVAVLAVLVTQRQLFASSPTENGRPCATPWCRHGGRRWPACSG